MYSFIFGFQRLVWCPKWTPASSSSFMLTDGRGQVTASCDRDHSRPCRHCAPGFPASADAARGRLGRELTLAELEAATGALLPVLLALLDAGVARQEARLLEPLAQLEVEHAQRARDAVAQRAGLRRRRRRRPAIASTSNFSTVSVTANGCRTSIFSASWPPKYSSRVCVVRAGSRPCPAAGARGRWTSCACRCA